MFVGAGNFCAVIVSVDDIGFVSVWFPSPTTFTYTVVVPTFVLVGFVVLHVLLSVLYCIVPPEPPETLIVWDCPSYVPEYAVKVGFAAETFLTVNVPFALVML